MLLLQSKESLEAGASWHCRCEWAWRVGHVEARLVFVLVSCLPSPGSRHRGPTGKTLNISYVWQSTFVRPILVILCECRASRREKCTKWTFKRRLARFPTLGAREVLSIRSKLGFCRTTTLPSTLDPIPFRAGCLARLCASLQDRSQSLLGQTFCHLPFPVTGSLCRPTSSRRFGQAHPHR